MITGVTEAIPLLKGGSLDISHGGHTGFLQAHQEGALKVRILAEASSMAKNVTAIMVPKDSEIRGPKDLAGKKIATNAKGNSELIGGTTGIGAHLINAQQTFDMPGMWAGIVLLGGLGCLLNGIFLLAERSVLAWHTGARPAEPIS